MKMSRTLYFPPLTRQRVELYKSQRGDFFAKYNCEDNYKNVSADCQNRCVYCDAMVDECGGEPFSLDHFRPLEVFGEKFDGVLKIHPFNLHLSCQKCNVLKTNDWKGCQESIDGPSHISGKGYIDRFKDDITKYLEVDNDGRLRCIDSSGPAAYIIGKLLLNRTNRVYIRKLRAVKTKAEIVHAKLIKRQREVVDKLAAKQIRGDDACEQLKKITELLERFQKLGLIGK